MRRFSSTAVVRMTLPGGRRLDAWVADSRLTRLIGLAGLRRLPPGTALLLPDCRCVHTFGMRFAIDVAFLSWPTSDGACEVAAVAAAVVPGRLISARGPLAALEAPAGALAAAEIVPGDLCQVACRGVRR